MNDRRWNILYFVIGIVFLLTAGAILFFRFEDRLRPALHHLGLSKPQQTQENPVAENPSIVEALKSLPASSDNAHAIVLFSTGDAASGIHYFALRWREKSLQEVAVLPSIDAVRARRVQVNQNGTLAYTLVDSTHRDRLVVKRGSACEVYEAPFHERRVEGWSNGSGARFEDGTEFPPFGLSPDGHTIVVYANRGIAFSDSAEGTVFTEFSISSIAVGEPSFGPLRLDTIAQGGYFADESFRRFLAGWCIADPACVLFSDFNAGQLYGTTQHLWKYSTATRQYTLLSPKVERYFSISLDDQFVLYTNNDETCCAGINYTDNQLIRLSVANDSTDILFDEFESFNNNDKGENHAPLNAELSPDKKRVATTIDDFIDLNSPTSEPTERDPGVADSLFGDRYVLVMHSDGAEEREYHDRELLGWVDESHLLVRPYSETWQPSAHDWKEVRGDVRVLDVENGGETPCFSQPVTFIGIQWELGK
jgi:hypothetical protein